MNMQRTRMALATLALVLGIPEAHAVVITSNWDPISGTIRDLPQEVFPAANRADFSTTIAPIDTILVDITYSMFASVDQQGPATLGARSLSGVVVADAATYAPFNVPTTPYEVGFIDPVFSALANAGNLFGATNSIDGATGRSTFAIRPTPEYW